MEFRATSTTPPAGVGQFARFSRLNLTESWPSRDLEDRAVVARIEVTPTGAAFVMFDASRLRVATWPLEHARLTRCGPSSSSFLHEDVVRGSEAGEHKLIEITLADEGQSVVAESKVEGVSCAFWLACYNNRTRYYRAVFKKAR